MGRMEAFFFYFTQDDNNSQRRGHLERNMQKGKTSDVNKIFFLYKHMHIFHPALPWKETENWLTHLQFIAGIYIEWKNHACLGS